MKVPIVKNILPLNASPLSSALLTFHKMLGVKSGKMPKSWVSYSMDSSHMELLGVLFLKEKTSCLLFFFFFFW